MSLATQFEQFLAPDPSAAFSLRYFGSLTFEGTLCLRTRPTSVAVDDDDVEVKTDGLTVSGKWTRLAATLRGDRSQIEESGDIVCELGQYGEDVVVRHGHEMYKLGQRLGGQWQNCGNTSHQPKKRPWWFNSLMPNRHSHHSSKWTIRYHL